MDHELKSYLDGMESRIVSKVDALGVRIGGLEAGFIGLETRFNESEARRKADDEAAEIRMKEHVETVETRLLTEFWVWAKSSDIKSRAHSENIGFIASNGVSGQLRIFPI